MLQKLDKDRLDKVLQVIETCKIRFPNKEISQRLGVDSGNVSAYIKGRKPMSDNFYTSFLSEFDTTKSYVERRRDKKNTHEPADIPVSGGNTNLGNITVYQDENGKDDIIATLPANMFPGSDYAEKAKGDSMYPIIMNQAWLVGKVAKNRGITYGEKYIIKTKDGLDTTKYVHPAMDENKKRIDGKLLLVAHNKSIPAQEIDMEDITFACRVYWIINPT